MLLFGTAELKDAYVDNMRLRCILGETIVSKAFGRLLVSVGVRNVSKAMWRIRKHSLELGKRGLLMLLFLSASRFDILYWIKLRITTVLIYSLIVGQTSFGPIG